MNRAGNNFLSRSGFADQQYGRFGRTRSFNALEEPDHGARRGYDRALADGLGDFPAEQAILASQAAALARIAQPQAKLCRMQGPFEIVMGAAKRDLHGCLVIAG